MANSCEICKTKLPGHSRGTICRKCWLRKTQNEIITTKTITEEQIKLLKRESKGLLSYLYSNVYEAFGPDKKLSQREINILNEIQKTFGLSKKDVHYKERIGQQINVDTTSTGDELPDLDLQFESKPEFKIEECCKQFYDKNIFSNTTGGKDVWSELLDSHFESVAKVDKLFSSVDKEPFRNEMTALRMILFAFAIGCSKKLNKDEFPLQASFYTRSYLKEKGRLDIFDIMPAYNRAIARSAIMDSNLQQYSGKTGNGVIIRLNDLRSQTALRWTKAYLGKIVSLEEQKSKISCINMAANRLGADMEREDGVALKSLSATLANRLTPDENLNSEATSELSAIILGFYSGAEEYLDSFNNNVTAEITALYKTLGHPEN